MTFIYKISEMESRKLLYIALVLIGFIVLEYNACKYLLFPLTEKQIVKATCNITYCNISTIKYIVGDDIYDCYSVELTYSFENIFKSYNNRDCDYGYNYCNSDKINCWYIKNDISTITVVKSELYDYEYIVNISLFMFVNIFYILIVLLVKN